MTTPITLTITVPVEINLQLISDLLFLGLEGGTDWIMEAQLNIGSEQYFSGQEDARVAYDLMAFEPNGYCKLCIAPEDPAYFFVHDDATCWELTKEDLIDALILLAKKFPQHFRSVVDGKADAKTANLFLQFACMKESIYTL